MSAFWPGDVLHNYNILRIVTFRLMSKDLETAFEIVVNNSATPKNRGTHITNKSIHSKFELP